MTDKKIEQFFKALYSTFPRSDILILDKQKEIIFSKLFLSVLTPDHFTSQPMSCFRSNNDRFFLISLPLPGDMHLLLALQKGDFSSPNTPMTMVHSIQQTIFLADMQALPRLIKDKSSLFLKQLLHVPITEDTSLISMLAKEAGIDLTLPRVVCVIEFAESLDDREYQKQNLLFNASELIRNFHLTCPDDIVGISENYQLLLCHRLVRENLSIKAQCSEFFLELRNYLAAQLGRQTFIGVGFAVSNIPEYTHSYSCANLALQYINAHSDSISYAIDHLMEIIFENTPLELLTHFFDEDIQRLTENTVLFKTLESLLMHNFNTSETSNSMFIHRNTLMFRIKQLKSILNLDPFHNDNDRYTLHLIYNYYKWKVKLFSNSLET